MWILKASQHVRNMIFIVIWFVTGMKCNVHCYKFSNEYFLIPIKTYMYIIKKKILTSKSAVHFTRSGG